MIAKELDSRYSTGLSELEAAARLKTEGYNELPASRRRPLWAIVVEVMGEPMFLLLVAAAALYFFLGDLQEAALLLASVLVIIGITLYQERKTERALEALRDLSSPRALVIRDGQRKRIAGREVARGELVVLSEGDRVPADAVLVSHLNLSVDESLLTGESDPIEKAPGDEVLSGSFVVAGSGRYQATRVGRQAYAVRLAGQARRFTLTRSELRDGTNRILKYVSWVIVPTGILLFWSQLRVQGGWRRAVSGAVAGTVAMVPEGLVLLLSIAFAAAVVRLAQGRVLVQELPAVEGLARVDVLCIDKTGTLTEGTVEVSSIQPLGATTTADVEAALAAIAANDPSPNATTHAIAARFPGRPAGWVATGAVPFSSVRKWSAMAFERQGA